MLFSIENKEILSLKSFTLEPGKYIYIYIRKNNRTGIDPNVAPAYGAAKKNIGRLK